MAQEFIIKSQDIEDKINQLLPSQGGFQAGVDFSASTMVIPIVDLTETAEGSSLRQDLQRAKSLVSNSTFSVQNTTVTQVNTTGYFNVEGVSNCFTNAGGVFNQIFISDGVTDRVIWAHSLPATSTFALTSVTFNIDVFLKAGDVLKIQSFNNGATINGSTRQIADLSGNLVNPS